MQLEFATITHNYSEWLLTFFYVNIGETIEMNCVFQIIYISHPRYWSSARGL